MKKELAHRDKDLLAVDAEGSMIVGSSCGIAKSVGVGSLTPGTCGTGLTLVKGASAIFFKVSARGTCD